MNQPKTNKEWAEYFASQPEHELSAVPFIWHKEDAVDYCEYMLNNFDTELTDEEWAEIIKLYENNERFHEDSADTFRVMAADVLARREEGN